MNKAPIRAAAGREATHATAGSPHLLSKFNIINAGVQLCAVYTSRRRTVEDFDLRFNRPEIWTMSAAFMLVGLVLAFDHGATKLDQAILLLFRNTGDVSDPIGPPWLEEMARDLTALGSYAVVSIVSGAVVIYLLLARQRAAAFWISAAVGGGILLSNLLKFAIERPRPDFVPHAARVFTTSFPSGHATLSAIIYLTLGVFLARLHDSFYFKVYFFCLAIFLMVAVGISRIYLGVHYPTDILAGWCVGAAWAGFCSTIFRWLQCQGHVGPPPS
jgi:undecaprenyl-diphosphatase